MSEDQRAHFTVILAQHAHHLFGIRGLGKLRETTQVKKHHRDFPPVRLEGILSSAGDDQVRQLRREEALEPSQTLELSNLVLHSLLEVAVPLGQFLGLCLDSVVEFLDAKQRTHPCEEFGLIHGLGQEIVGPGIKALDPLLRGIERRHHHHGEYCGFRGCANPPAHFVPAYVGHDDIEQDQVRLFRRDLLQRFCARRRRHHRIALYAKQIHQKFHIPGCVVHDENFCRIHGDTPALRGRLSISLTAATNSFTLIGLDW